MIDLVYVGMLIIGLLNQFKSPVRRIISIFGISAMVWIGLLLFDRLEMNSVLLSNTSYPDINLPYHFPIATFRTG